MVQLWSASLPSALRTIAVHSWFVAYDPATNAWARWEVWQRAEAGGQSWGHVHRDLMRPDRPVGGGPSFNEAEWVGDEAEALLRVLATAPEYPARHRYRYWPGPNSNTFAAWVLGEAGIRHALDPRAVGKDYLGLAGVRMRRGSGLLQVETPLIGVKADLTMRSLELHLLSLTFGLELRPGAATTPLGRVHFPRRRP